MLLSVEGKYEDGRIELVEAPPGVRKSRVVVTFLEPPVDSEFPLTHRREAGDRLLARLEAGIDFGGARFNRGELYAERLDRIARGDG
jgi:hypothetical protein